MMSSGQRSLGTLEQNFRQKNMAVVVKTVKRDPILVGIGEFTTHFTTYSGNWDVHWGYDLDFDPWPHVCSIAIILRAIILRECIDMLLMDAMRHYSTLGCPIHRKSGRTWACHSFIVHLFCRRRCLLCRYCMWAMTKFRQLVEEGPLVI